MPPLDFQTLADDISNNSSSLEAFFTQNKDSLARVSEISKQLQQELLDHKNDIEHSLKQLQLETEHNQPILAKWLAGSNTKLQTEQISQTRRNLCETVQKHIDTLKQLSQDIDNHLNQYITSTQEFTSNFNKLVDQINSANSTGSGSNLPPPMDQMLQQAMDALNTASMGMEQRKVLADLNKSIENLIN